MKRFGDRVSLEPVVHTINIYITYIERNTVDIITDGVSYFINE